MADIDRVYTETPLIDEIVYQVKGMIYDGIVLKDEDEANNNETLNSIKLADRYAAIVEGTDKFELWTYEYNTLMKIPHITRQMAILYAKNNSLIDEKTRPLLLKIKQEEFLESYEEQNNYYRMLNGLPNLGEAGVKMNQDEIDKLGIRTFEVGKYIHEMTDDEISILKATGVLEDIQARYPNKPYLQHLGDKSINPYLARKANRFGLLYLPPCESTEVYNKFRDRLEVNRVFMLNTIYSQAYKFQSDYYDRFIMIMIIIQSFIDMIELSPEYIIQRELFDLRTIQYVFESQGVEFFPDIPLKYQKRLVKNLNTLIKYKSCDKNLLDIVSLFGFDNIELFKYYILKDPIMLEDGTYKKDTYTDPKTGEEVEDYEANYELKFLKVPIDGGIAEEAIRDPFNLLDYDEIVHDDVYWNGPYTPEYVKHVILEHEYNMVISKYIGLEATYSLTELTMQLCYIVNMIMYTDVDKSRLEIEVPELGSNDKYPLVDLFITLFALKYIYLGVKDKIIYNPVQALDVMGFNFETDIAKLAEYIAEHDITLEEMGASNFNIPKDGILTFKQLIEIYTNNRNIYDHLVHEIVTADNKEIYDLYKKVYDSLMITKLNFDYFRSEGVEPVTYTEFLEAKNSPLYQFVLEAQLIENEEERKKECSKIINYIVDNIYIYLDEDIFGYIFDGIPTVSLNYIRRYVFEVLNFFKSYKVDFTHVNIVYKFDDRLNNWISIIDRVLFTRVLHKHEHVQIDDYLDDKLIHWTPKELIGLLEIIHLDVIHWKRIRFEDYIWIRDHILKIIKKWFRDYGSPWWDGIKRITYVLEKGEVIKASDSLVTTIHLNLQDTIIPEDIIDY